MKLEHMSAGAWAILLGCLLLAVVDVNGPPAKEPGSSFIDQPVLVCEDPASLNPELDLAVGKMIRQAEEEAAEPLPLPEDYYKQPSWHFLRKKYRNKLDSLVKYWPVFVDEQNVSGVPAEVNASQFFLESGCGDSWLARNANNFFGIKAGHHNGKRWVMYNKVYGQSGVVWREDDCSIHGIKVKCPFVKFRNPSACFRAKSALTARKFKPSQELLTLYKGREWRAWVDKLAPATDESKEYRERKKIKNYASGDSYHEKILRLNDQFRFYLWPRDGSLNSKVAGK